jgi:periplasmic copper chaperone A
VNKAANFFVCALLSHRDIDVPPQLQTQLNSVEVEVGEEFPMRGRMTCGFIAAMGWMAASSMAHAGEAMLKVTEAWVPAAEKVGGDIPLLLTVRNDADAEDTLLRVKCPVANFSERHTVDRGEGAPAMRSIRSIPIAAASTTILKADGYHVMLLQTRQPLPPGEKFKCSIDFQKAGTIETEVNVRSFP